MLPASLCETLQRLAARYETASFIDGDPSWFMHQVCGDRNREAMAFVAAAISYGSRQQFMPRIQWLLDASGGDMDAWVRSGAFEGDGPRVLRCDDASCFYRLQTCADMNAFLRAFRALLVRHGSLRDFVAKAVPVGARTPVPGLAASAPTVAAISAIAAHFAAAGSKGVIPKDATSACKRVCMFLRWMVRTDSPVDLGLWADVLDRRSLIMPLDTHVVQEALRLGLTRSRTTSMASARRLTATAAEVFPDDPLLADFALFGYGVDPSTNDTRH